MPFIPGDNAVICDRCGFRKLRSQCTIEADTKLLVCGTCLQEPHPGDHYKYRETRTMVKDPRPAGEPVFIEPGSVKPSDYPSGNMGGA